MKRLTVFFVFFFSFVKAFAQPSFDWVRPFSVGFPTEAKFIGVDVAKNVYVVMNFKNDVDVDPGPGVYMLSAAPNKENFFIAKLDAAGNFLWAKQIGYDQNVLCNSLFVDPAGGVYMSGSFGGTVDFDPGPAVYNLPNSAGSVFIAKLDTNGNFQWAEKIEGSGSMYEKFIYGDNYGNIYITGNYSGTFDFDPGTAVHNETSTGSENVFILKLDQAGNFKFAKIFHGNDLGFAEYIKTDNAGNVYTSGYFSGIVDFDPGPAVLNISGIGSSNNYFLVKLDSTGNLVWAKKDMSTAIGYQFGIEPDQTVITYSSFAISKYDVNCNLVWSKPFGTHYLWPSGLQNTFIVDDAGTMYITGRFNFTEDFDPGPTVYNMTPLGTQASADVFICRLDVNADFMWAKSFGGYADDFAVWMAIDIQGDIHTLGSFQNNVDFDPDSPVFNLSAGAGTKLFVHKMAACANVTASNLNPVACNSYTLNGTTYTSSGTYTQVTTNASGCDSVITVNLTISGSTTNLTAIACDNYNWQGQLLISSGLYSDTLLSATGCDSILNLNLVINHSVTTDIVIAICEGQDYGGYTTDGTYNDTFTASNGCDSIRTLHLTVNPKRYSSINKSVCEGESYEGHNATGIYTDHFTGSNGCDSIRTLTLTVNPSHSVEITKTICEGGSYAGHSSTGTYIDTLFNSNGCDSIIKLKLTVEKKQMPDLGPDVSICYGDTLSLHAGVFQSYLWQDGSIKDHYTVKQPGLYSVDVNGPCGMAHDEIVVGEKSCKIYFPEAFTPNNDGVNDRFIILNPYKVTEYHLYIYDRYGKKIFETENPLSGWNGKINGLDATSAAYVWYADFKVSGILTNIKGTVILLR